MVHNVDCITKFLHIYLTYRYIYVGFTYTLPTDLLYLFTYNNIKSRIKILYNYKIIILVKSPIFNLYII